MDINDASPFVVINGRALQIMTWNGPTIPDGWVPLDGRTIAGVTLPDRRDKFLYCTRKNAAEVPTPAILILSEIVRLHDLIVDGELKIPGIFPTEGGI